MPFATSEIVPSPPQAIISSVPFRAASLASAVPSPASLVKARLKDPKCELRSLAICGQAWRVAPLADSGLTMTSGNDIRQRVQPQINADNTDRKKSTKVHSLFCLIRFIRVNLWRVCGSVLLAEFSDALHHGISYLFMCAQAI